MQSNDGRAVMGFKKDEPRTLGSRIAKGPIGSVTMEMNKEGLMFPCCARHKEYGIRAFGCDDMENCRYLEIAGPVERHFERLKESVEVFKANEYCKMNNSNVVNIASQGHWSVLPVIAEEKELKMVNIASQRRWPVLPRI